MKALVYRGPWDMAIEERPDRDPGRLEAKVEILATGICGSDIHGFTGHTGRRHPNQVMGHETVGWVRELGSGVTGISEGTLVSINPAMICGECPACRRGDHELCIELKVLGVVPEIDAAFAEFVTVPAMNLVPLDEALTPLHGALIEPLAVGHHALLRGNAGKDDSVLIIGGGPIGQASALAARRQGVESILIVDPIEQRRGILTALGFICASPDDIAAAIRQNLPETPTLVVDAVGNNDTVAAALMHSARGSRIVLVGMAEKSLTLPAYEVSVAERTVIGTFCYSHGDFSSTAQWAAAHDSILGVLLDGVKLLSEGPDTFTKLARHELAASKILLTPSAEFITH